LGFSGEPAIAQQDAALSHRHTGTLKKINDSGVVRVGYRQNSPRLRFSTPTKTDRSFP
jgi:hypothetical protein